MRNDEFRSVKEYTSVNENKTFQENQIVRENAPVLENVEAEENKDTVGERPKTKREFDQSKKNQALNALSGGLTTVIAGVVVGITTMLNVSMTASFNSVTYEDGNIAYEVNVVDMTEKETLTAYLYEGTELLYTIPLVDEDSDGLINGTISLDSNHIAELLSAGENVNVSYRLDLKGVVGLDVERAFDSYVVSIDKMTSKFEDIEGECHCSEDGCFHFRMNFTDDYQLFDNFEAWITDVNGKTNYCEFSDNLHDEQKIFVSDLFQSGTLTISYTSDGVAAEPITIDVRF